ncbi:MAG: WYL domain-containing protein [Candidatus Eisenbacteria bacterium]|nr:WYL domain-containing protein [Candidatus Eisenbacteria bacterium]
MKGPEVPNVEKRYPIPLPFVAFDVETTGLHALCDRIVEVGAVRFGFEGAGEAFESLVNPGCRIPPEVSALHGISDDDVADAPAFADLSGDLLRFLEGGVLVAHNAPFDASFLLSECHRAEACVPSLHVFDSCRLARAAFPGLPSYSLDALVGAFSIERGRGHRALPDAAASADLFLRSIRALGVRDAGDLPRLYDAVGAPLPLRALGFDPEPELPTEHAPIADALARGTSVRILYEDRFGKKSRRTVRPLRVVSVQGCLMMEAHCLLRGGTRCFRLDRVREFDP